MHEIIFISIAVIAAFIILFVRLKRLNKARNDLDWTGNVPGWPIIGNAMEFGDTSDLIDDVARLIKNHGKIVFLNFATQPNLFTTDYDFIEFVLSTHNVLNKSEDYRFLRSWLGTGLLTSDGPKWKKHRKITTPAFHFSILEQFIECFESNGKILVEKLRKETNKNSIDIYPFINLHTLDIICESAMGVEINAQKFENSKYVNNVKMMCKIGITRSTSMFKCNDILYTLTPDFYKEKIAVKNLHDVTYNVIDSKMKLLGRKIDSMDAMEDEFGRKKRFAFLDVLLHSNVDNKPLTRHEIRQEVDTFMFAGHDTTSSALSFALYLLAQHWDIQCKAFDEQKMIFNDDLHRNATIKDLNEMKYLERVIKEVLRLYPPVPMFGRYTDKNVVYKGKIVPKGVNIVVFTYGVMRDPDNFNEPDKFDPDRFENFDGKRPFSYIPFSAGPRNCIGQKFAMLEMKSTLSKILRNFELFPADPKHDLILLAEAVLKSKTGLHIKISVRTF